MTTKTLNLGPQARRALAALDWNLGRATLCQRRLATLGLTATHADVDLDGTPIVWVSPDPRCATLIRDHGAEVVRIEGHAWGLRRTWQASLMGCYVQWIQLIGGMA